MVRPDDVAALVLAAGMSSRMGKFKPLLPIGEHTLIEQVIKNIRAASIQRILVVVGYKAETLIPVLERNQVSWVENPNSTQEMFLSVKVGIRRLEKSIPAFFLLPCDMPFVSPQTYGKLLSAFDPVQMDIIRPRYLNRNGHPVLISVSKIPSMVMYSGDGGLRSLVKQQGWRIVDHDCNDPGIAIDLNFPEDYENAASRIAHPQPDRSG
jgi:molybdenum cofactor cytidylyltransferase